MQLHARAGRSVVAGGEAARAVGVSIPLLGPLLGALLGGLLAGPLAGGASAMSEAQKERYRKAYEKFQKLGEIREDWPVVPWARAYTVKSFYYKVKTNTSLDVARYIGTLMDAQAAALRKIFRFRMTIGKINIWAPRTRGDFVRVAAQELRIPVGSSTGGFWTNAMGGTICLPYVARHNLHPVKVMMHEATHQFLHKAIGNNIPTWVDEGLAVFFEESKYNPATKKLEVFIVPRIRLLHLQHEMKADRNVRLDQLFATPREAFTARHYGAAWSFIYWLFRSACDNRSEGLRRQKALNTYLYDIKKGKKSYNRLFTYLGMQLGETEKKWKEWVLTLDANDERGGTRMPGEPPYEPKKGGRDGKDGGGGRQGGRTQPEGTRMCHGWLVQPCSPTSGVPARLAS